MSNMNRPKLEIDGYEIPSFDKEWTVKDWEMWSYWLGLKLDWHTEPLGVDNRERLEKAIIQFRTEHKAGKARPCVKLDCSTPAGEQSLYCMHHLENWINNRRPIRPPPSLFNLFNFFNT